MLIDGKAIASTIASGIRAAVSELTGRPPSLAVILVGEHPASLAYVTRKATQAEHVGIQSTLIRFPESITEETLLAEVARLNTDDTVDGILVQLPLPPHISTTRVTLALDPSKDVDGFHPINLGKLLAGDTSGFVPCTPLGIVELLAHTNIPVAGKHVVIVGRSQIVGRPLSALLLQKRNECNATVTVAHSATRDLPAICQQADILIAAMGQPKAITAAMVQPGAAVVDVGINRIPDTSTKQGYRLVGDVAFDEVASKVRAITPVPGGVGPMTVAMLLQNTLTSRLRR